MDEQWLERIVAGCLRSTIDAHGDITKEWIGSAAKRISHQIFGELKAAAAKGDGHEVCAEKLEELEKEIKRLKRRNGVLTRTSDYWRHRAGGTEEENIESLKEASCGMRLSNTVPCTETTPLEASPSDTNTDSTSVP